MSILTELSNAEILIGIFVYVLAVVGSIWAFANDIRKSKDKERKDKIIRDITVFLISTVLYGLILIVLNHNGHQPTRIAAAESMSTHPTTILSPTPKSTINPTVIPTSNPTVAPTSNVGGSPTQLPLPTATRTSTSVPFTLICLNYNSEYGQSSPDITLSVRQINVTGSNELTFRYSIQNTTSTDITNWTMGSSLTHSDGTSTNQGPNPDNTLIAAHTTFTFDITYDNLATNHGAVYQLNIEVQESGAWTYQYATKTIVL